tara:strand:- start:208 stop:495 length:288 start_codon:yes stop_codon:yes gene_type:complete
MSIPEWAAETAQIVDPETGEETWVVRCATCRRWVSDPNLLICLRCRRSWVKRFRWSLLRALGWKKREDRINAARLTHFTTAAMAARRMQEGTDNE